MLANARSLCYSYTILRQRTSASVSEAQTYEQETQKTPQCQCVPSVQAGIRRQDLFPGERFQRPGCGGEDCRASPCPLAPRATSKNQPNPLLPLLDAITPLKTAHIAHTKIMISTIFPISVFQGYRLGQTHPVRYGSDRQKTGPKPS
jgi:hypothetical protein